MIDYDRILPLLADGSVEFIVVGGTAANIHGSARVTADLDVLYRRTRENLARLVAALGPLKPYLRGAPRGLPFRWDEETVQRGLNFTLTTEGGDIDLLGEMAGVGTWAEAIPRSFELAFRGVTVRVIELDALIAAKRAAGRPKDFEVLAELEVIREEKSEG
ncbi:MAG TPA: hypothetical protein VF701_06730 [Thermoanaerobaculia bacterium]